MSSQHYPRDIPGGDKNLPKFPAAKFMYSRLGNGAALGRQTGKPNPARTKNISIEVHLCNQDSQEEAEMAGPTGTKSLRPQQSGLTT